MFSAMSARSLYVCVCVRAVWPVRQDLTRPCEGPKAGREGWRAGGRRVSSSRVAVRHSEREQGMQRREASPGVADPPLKDEEGRRHQVLHCDHLQRALDRDPRRVAPDRPQQPRRLRLPKARTCSFWGCVGLAIGTLRPRGGGLGDGHSGRLIGALALAPQVRHPFKQRYRVTRRTQAAVS